MDEVGGEVALRGGGERECVEENGCALPLILTKSPLPCVRQLFVWRSRSLVQALDHAPLHPNGINFTGAAGRICFGTANGGIQTGLAPG